jgi:predicted XRE-type DNA-binding protein
MSVDNKQLDEIKNEIAAIKLLFILYLMKNGISQAEIAKSLGVNQSTISRMLPKQKKGTTESPEPSVEEAQDG